MRNTSLVDLKIVIEASLSSDDSPLSTLRHTSTITRTLTAAPAESGDKPAGQRASAAMVRTRPRIVLWWGWRRA